MATLLSNTISISEFSKGLAGKIFKSVKDNGMKIVLKNNKPECVLMSPEEYETLMESYNDMKMMLLAESRMKDYDEKEDISFEEHLKQANLTLNDLKGFEDIDIE